MPAGIRIPQIFWMLRSFPGYENRTISRGESQSGPIQGGVEKYVIRWWGWATGGLKLPRYDPSLDLVNSLPALPARDIWVIDGRLAVFPSAAPPFLRRHVDQFCDDVFH